MDRTTTGAPARIPGADPVLSPSTASRTLAVSSSSRATEVLRSNEQVARFARTDPGGAEVNGPIASLFPWIAALAPDVSGQFGHCGRAVRPIPIESGVII